MVTDVFQKLEPRERPPRESILRMRWILEYQLDENENKSPKVPIVTLGYYDPDYEDRPAASPIMTTNTRQTVTVTIRIMGGVLCSQWRRKWCVLARPQTSTRPLGTTSTRSGGSEHCSGEIMKLKKAAYGLEEAPAEWCLSKSTVLEEHVASLEIRPMLWNSD